MSKIICFGELLLRLSSPGNELLLQSPRLDMHVGGAEGNVAVALATLGHDVALATILPDNPLGYGVRNFVRGHGVDCRFIQFAPGRMGLYWLQHGAGGRASEVLYDRAHSAFAEHLADGIDWSAVMEGASWLHLSGITPALGPHGAKAAVKVMRAAKAAGIRISFDGNYRSKLWESWPSDPRSILHELVSMADLFFGNHRDIALILGAGHSGETPQSCRAAAEAAFAAFPALQYAVSTARRVVTGTEHYLSARFDTRDAAYQTDEAPLNGIVDRIGAGDAFAAGVLHGLLTEKNIPEILDDGLAMMLLAHTIPGDATPFSAADMISFRQEGLDVRR